MNWSFIIRCDVISCAGFAGPLPMVFKPGQVSCTADTYQTLISTRLVSLGDWGQGGTLVAATT